MNYELVCHVTFGPIVTATASARTSTPWSMSALTSEPNRTSLAYQRCTWAIWLAWRRAIVLITAGSRYIWMVNNEILFQFCSNVKADRGLAIWMVWIKGRLYLDEEMVLTISDCNYFCENVMCQISQMVVNWREFFKFIGHSIGICSKWPATNITSKRSFLCWILRHTSQS